MQVLRKTDWTMVSAARPGEAKRLQRLVWSQTGNGYGLSAVLCAECNCRHHHDVLGPRSQSDLMMTPSEPSFRHQGLKRIQYAQTGIGRLRLV